MENLCAISAAVDKGAHESNKFSRQLSKLQERLEATRVNSREAINTSAIALALKNCSEIK